jgi:hypothetical protein
MKRVLNISVILDNFVRVIVIGFTKGQSRGGGTCKRHSLHDTDAIDICSVGDLLGLAFPESCVNAEVE